MPAPVYFCCDATLDGLFPDGRPDPAALAEFGLAAAWADVRPRDLEQFKEQVAAVEYRQAVGPGGRNGLMLTLGMGLAQSRYYASFDPAAEQPWQWLVPDKTLVLLDAVRPEDLLRAAPRRHGSGGGLRAVRPAVRGYEVELADGQSWTVPIVRTPRWEALSVRPFGAGRDLDRTCLPRASGFAADGQPVRRVRSDHAALWEEYRELLEPLWLQRLDGSYAAQYDLAVRTLAVNYRLDGPLAAALGLLDEDSAREVLECAADAPFFWWTLRRNAGENVPDFFPGPAAPAD